MFQEKLKAIILMQFFFLGRGGGGGRGGGAQTKCIMGDVEVVNASPYRMSTSISSLGVSLLQVATGRSSNC